MPVLPSRSMKKYSSLPTESPSDVRPPKSGASRTLSDPTTGNRIIKAFLNFRRRSEDTVVADYNLGDASDSLDSDSGIKSSRMTETPRSKDWETSDMPDRPCLPLHFQNKDNQMELPNSPEEKSETSKDECTKSSSKRPTLGPFFSSNHNFMKALRGRSSKDNFTRLETVGDE